MLKFCESEYKNYWEGKYLRFIDFGKLPGQKTNTYEIRSTLTNQILGSIKWWSPWRKYVFSPHDSMFDARCLTEVVEFLNERTEAHRATLPKREMSREARMKLYQKKRLTKEQNSGSLENVRANETNILEEQKTLGNC
jgi:hypothetical protein